MADGGIFPWKLQKIQQPSNGVAGTCRYADLKKPLPDPPKGQTWVQDENSREWRLIPVATATADDDDAGGDGLVAAVAQPSGDGAIADATTDYAAVAAVAVAETSPIDPKDKAGDGTIRYHRTLPTDTFQGICLRYKITPTELRRANNMTLATNLRLAPEVLVIPSNDRNTQLKNTGEKTKEEKIASVLSGVSRRVRGKLSYSEVRAYLEIADWDVEDAVRDVNEDFAAE